jgi:hypothetical protein
VGNTNSEVIVNNVALSDLGLYTVAVTQGLRWLQTGCPVP